MKSRPGGIDQVAVRVGDAEREACAAALLDHHLDGRLDVDELDRRQRAARVAVTTAELQLLLVDLPELALAPSSMSRSRAGGSGTASKVAAFVIPAATVLGGASLSQLVWTYSAEGPFLGAVLGGVLGYTVRAVMSRSRR